MADDQGQQSVVRYMSAEDVTSEITDHKGHQTTLKHFKEGVFHTYKLGGPTGKTKLTEERSAKIRYSLCGYIRTKGYSIRQAGALLTFVCGQEDNVTIDLLANGKSLAEVEEDLRIELQKAMRRKPAET